MLDVPVGSPTYNAGSQGSHRIENGLIEIGGDMVKVTFNRVIPGIHMGKGVVIKKLSKERRLIS